MHALIDPYLFLLAQEPMRQSYLMWMFQSLGLFYAVVLPLSGLMVFLGAVIVVCVSRRPSVIAAYLVFLPLPILIGAYATVEGMIASYSVIASTATTPDPAEVAGGYSTALFSSLLGIFLTFPSFIVLAIGLFARTVFWRGDTDSQAHKGT